MKLNCVFNNKFTKWNNMLIVINKCINNNNNKYIKGKIKSKVLLYNILAMKFGINAV